MNFLQCCNQRKSVAFPKTEIVVKEEKIYCGSKSCNNRVYKAAQIAIFGDNKYYFCTEKCYYNWLKQNLFSALKSIS